MPKIDIRIDVNTSKVTKTLTAISQAYDCKVLKIWGRGKATEHASNAFLKNFDSEGSNLGKKWGKLAISTMIRRARKGFGAGHPILVRTGKLKREVVGHKPSVRCDPDLEIDWGGANVGDERYVWHQAGYRDRGGGYVPARPMVGFNPQDAKTLAISLHRFIAAQIRWGRL